MGNKSISITLLKVSIVIICFMVLFHVPFASARDGTLRLHFIDVGEGESIYIETPYGKFILLDTGNLITGYKLVNYLKHNEVPSLDYLIFSHHHPDHIGGAFFLLQMMDVWRMVDNGADLSELSTQNDLYRWWNQLVRESGRYETINAAGQVITFGSVSLKVLWPPAPLPHSSPNPNSIVLMVQYHSFKALLTADITTEVEQELLKQDINLEAQVLKVAHHGHSDATSEEFIAAVSPRVSIISTNKNNIHGYPAEEVIERLKKHDSSIYTTYDNGSIIVRALKNGRYKVESER